MDEWSRSSPFRQDRHRRRQGRTRQSKIAARAVAFHLRQDALVARYGDTNFDSVGRRRQGRRHNRYDRRLPALRHPSQPEGGRRRLGNQGGDTGDVGTINVVDLTGKPRASCTRSSRQIVEGLAFSNDGNYVALTAQDGSARAPTHPFYNDK